MEFLKLSSMEKDSLFQRMQDYLKGHSTEQRRMIFLDGTAVASALSGALAERLPGTPWYEDEFQLGVTTDERGQGVAVLATRETLDSDCRGAVHITLTTHGLEEASFRATRDDWWSWWTSRVDAPQLAIG